MLDMRNTIIILFIGFTSFYGNSQSIISLEQYATYRCEDCVPPEDLVYVKDLNNTLEKYTGIWQGNDGATQVKYEIRKYLYIDDDDFKQDGLIVRYELKNLNTNQIILSTMGLPDDNLRVMQGWNYIGNKYYANYLGYDGCGQYGWAILDHNFSLLNGEEFKISILVTGEVYDQPQCTNGVIPSPIPSNIPLTRI
jgi:hypothetical protein